MRTCWLVWLIVAVACMGGATAPPANDLYGEKAWASQRVNPFMGNRPKLPDKYIIDCTGFHPPLSQQMRVSSKYGYRNSFGRMHWGIDLATPVGRDVHASWAGRVRIAAYDPHGYGNYIVIRHNNGLETIYGHLMSRGVMRGDSVSKGEVIGRSGNTGRSTGPHLHYEMRFLGSPIDPDIIVNANTGKTRYEAFLWKKEYYYTISKTQKRLNTARVTKNCTLEEYATEHDLDIEELCLLNGIIPEFPLKKGRLIRIP